jgi:hypothetical protein
MVRRIASRRPFYIFVYKEVCSRAKATEIRWGYKG